MKSIIVIGAGQLGSRHLQALALSEEPLQIYVVDPMEESRRTALDRFKQIESSDRHSLELFANLNLMNHTHLDFAVIATNSAIRASVVKNLLQQTKVEYLLLEKFLFQTESEYHQIGSLLKRKSVRTFVNCPRRLYTSYQDLKSQLKIDKPIHLEVVGNNWGLGSNGVHFIDLFQWLTHENIKQWNNHLDSGYFESKRPGYIEFSGKVYGDTRSGHSLSLTCYKDGPANISVRVSSSELRQSIEESAGIIHHYNPSTSPLKEEKSKFIPQYQSGLTNIVLQDLTMKGTCDLTPYEDSVKSHLPFLQLLLDHYNLEKSEKLEACPVT